MPKPIVAFLLHADTTLTPVYKNDQPCYSERIPTYAAKKEASSRTIPRDIVDPFYVVISSDPTQTEVIERDEVIVVPQNRSLGVEMESIVLGSHYKIMEAMKHVFKTRTYDYVVKSASTAIFDYRALLDFMKSSSAPNRIYGHVHSTRNQSWTTGWTFGRVIDFTSGSGMYAQFDVFKRIVDTYFANGNQEKFCKSGNVDDVVIGVLCKMIGVGVVHRPYIEFEHVASEDEIRKLVENSRTRGFQFRMHTNASTFVKNASLFQKFFAC